MRVLDELGVTRIRKCVTIMYMGTQSLRSFRDHLAEAFDKVEREHERIIVTRNGKPAAVLISIDDLSQLEETADVLADSDALADIAEGRAAYASGEVIRGVDAARSLRAAK